MHMPQNHQLHHQHLNLLFLHISQQPNINIHSIIITQYMLQLQDIITWSKFM